ncbi:MAG: biosis protein MshM [Betaproteobacteria bacterium]|jgi:MSHA biogenesis protein MshM|nr:biosis protein MshM [Betaproteobacteria bacterium]
MNYLGHFGLREVPFGITPDTDFFYPCRSSQQALNTLLVALENGEGFIKIIGEVGTGKTMLCRKLLATLDETSWVSAYIPNPNLEPRALLYAVAEELGLAVDQSMEQYRLLKRVGLTLLDLARGRRRVVLCMDESQAMPLETLEVLRLMTNLETEKRKLIQVVLFGQPELDERLASESVRQIRQRITFQHGLQGLDEQEVAAYFAHRLRVAGYSGPSLLSRGARRALFQASRGLPRLVNILSHKALLLLFGEDGPQLELRHIRDAATDTPAAAQPRPWWWPLPTLSRAG